MKEPIKQYLNKLLTNDCYNNYELLLDTILKKLNLSFMGAEFKNPKVSGMILVKEGICTIYVNKHHQITRKRFTIAHEIGHYISAICDSYSKEQLFKEGFEDGFALREEDVKSPAEIEANEIAAEMLMPEVLVRKLLEDGLSIEQMADQFYVSVVAMTVRVQRLVYNSGMYLL